ncbi:hypothetical protein LEP1GSC151_4168 [Leptospira interrogans serovar Grippotyphosa str. LT2186]|uniref:Uncharacterized protein n=4 Tax=Leptospira interrogans TaxID=173 RepID=M3I0M2_LEPIR|nr:hypothetical protein LEP1GSC151_4168 [Leptospira interrogans serovar Grippotyphosa str. LT2186]EMG19384.1 hypothetical protein LEP1GSC150_5174 [Leptospira interrogans serovar Copenhageni str. LT2050]EMN28450.1 hypothetical protein LEP1GSC083_4073 [Leptospira interrogans serovar Pyrogenes str. L0374]EMY25430.1 hypothetical protein LEP1GSC115_5743 [Leptospira interrogans serovar Australis str. 200703203]
MFFFLILYSHDRTLLLFAGNLQENENTMEDSEDTFQNGDS